MTLNVSLSYFIILLMSCAYPGLAIALYYSNRDSRANRILAAYLLLVWVFAILIVLYIGAGIAPHYLMPVQMAVVAFQGVVFFYFTRACVDTGFRWRTKDIIPFLPAVYFALYSAARITIPSMLAEVKETARVVDGTLYRQTDMHYLIYTVYLVLCYAAGIVHLARGMRKTMDLLERGRLRVILAAIITGILGVIVLVNVFTILGISGKSEYAIIPVTLSLAITSFTLLRHRAWKIEGLMDIVRERNRVVESELDTARLMQGRLLPSSMPRSARFSMAAHYLPMDKVGGDFYDYHERGSSLWVIIADVCGHGIPGAFLASVTKAGFQFYSPGAASAYSLIKSIDTMIARMTVKSLFVTASFIRLDADKMEISWCNCGHCYSLLHRRADGSIIELSARGGPLGLGLQFNYEERSMALMPGDRIIMHTDGITEARGSDGTLFGEDRLRQFTRDSPDSGPGDFVTRLFTALDAHASGAVPSDDMAVVVIDVGDTG